MQYRFDVLLHFGILAGLNVGKEMFWFFWQNHKFHL